MRWQLCLLAVAFVLLLETPSASAWWRRRRRRVDACANQRHDCTWKWGSCSRTCGGGIQRPVITKPKGKCGKCTLPNTRSCNTQCCPVNCQWGSWGGYGQCSKTCGSGSQLRRRSVAIVQKCGGRSCVGSTVQYRSCNTNCCPLNCIWGSWEKFGTCSKPCGGGSQVRSRKVLTNETCGGKCPGSTTDSRTCNTECCSVDCKWGVWGPFEPCSKTCGGGKQSRRRKIIHQSTCGGSNCTGSDIDTIDCSEHCCPVDCEWGPWTKFLECSATCGGGIQRRSRRPVVPATCGGNKCSGNDLDFRRCNEQCCPKDCIWGPWGNFGACSATCAGTHTRSRDVVSKQTCGGKCLGSSHDTQTCNSNCCPIDCRWASWSDYGSCSVSCGGGNQTRRRSFAVESSCGGEVCNGHSEQVRRCNNKCCPRNCVWGTWGEFSRCSANCGGGTQKRTRKVSMKQACGGHPCLGSSVDTQECNRGCCPVNCQWEKWGNFGNCSKPCGGGTQIRRRDMAVKSICGGDVCHGDETDSRLCNNKCCPEDCTWGAWSEFSQCTATCNGGKQSRHRIELTEKKCGGDPCVGKPKETRTCNTHCCPVDCVLNNWGDWSRCSTSCGPNGSSVRTRKIKVYPKCGGKLCNKKLKDMRPCNQNCLHQGDLSNGTCTCQAGWVGECCEKEAILQVDVKP